MQRERVVLLSNRSVLVAGVSSLLESIDALDVRAVAIDDPEALETIRRFAPDVIVLDSGGEATKELTIARLLRHHPQTKIVSLDLSKTDIDVYRVERLGDSSLDALLQAISG